MNCNKMKSPWLLLFVVIGCVSSVCRPRCGQCQSPPGVPAEAAALKLSVAALPADTEPHKLKKAMLLWALEDADADDQAGFADKAQVTLQDVQQALTRDIGQQRPAPPNLYPAIPDLDHNPIAQGAIKDIRKLLTDNQHYLKGPAGFTVKGPDGWHFWKTDDAALLLVQALCHPQSPLRGDPLLIAPILRRFETGYEYLTPGSPELADFGPSPSLTQMYLMFSAVYPDLILPSKKALWEKAIQTNTDAIMANRAQTFHVSAPGTAYPNADIKYIAALEYAGLLFHRADYTQAGEDGLHLLATAEFPDGGFAYIGLQNDSFTYHGIIIDQLVRIWLTTGDPLADRLVTEVTQLLSFECRTARCRRVRDCAILEALLEYHQRCRQGSDGRGSDRRRSGYAHRPHEPGLR